MHLFLSFELIVLALLLHPTARGVTIATYSTLPRLIADIKLVSLGSLVRLVEPIFDCVLYLFVSLELFGRIVFVNDVVVHFC